MSIYIAVFLSGWLFMRFSEVTRRKGDRLVANLCVAVAVLVPALVSGLRDLKIGTDTQGYMYNIFTETVAEEKNAKVIYDAFGGDYQLAYVFLAQVGRVIPNIHAFLFLAAALTFGVAAIAITVYDSKHASAPYVVYLLLIFNQSMNNSRQSIAISFGMLAAAGLLRRKRWTVVIGLVGAYLFHKSGLILLTYLPIYWITEWGRDYKSNTRSRITLFRGMVIVISIIGMVALVAEFQSLGPRLLSVLGLEGEYSVYLESYKGGVPKYIAIGQVIFVLVVYLARKGRRGGYFLLLAILYGAIIYFLTDISVYMYRVSMYFTSLTVLACANLYSSRVAGQERNASFNVSDSLRDPIVEGPRTPGGGVSVGAVLGRWTIVAVAGILWYIQIVIWGNNDTYPYASQILGIG